MKRTKEDSGMLKESLTLAAGILVVSAVLNGMAYLIESLRTLERERTWKHKI